MFEQKFAFSLVVFCSVFVLLMFKGIASSLVVLVASFVLSFSLVHDRFHWSLLSKLVN